MGVIINKGHKVTKTKQGGNGNRTPDVKMNKEKKIEQRKKQRNCDSYVFFPQKLIFLLKFDLSYCKAREEDLKSPSY